MNHAQHSLVTLRSSHFTRDVSRRLRRLRSDLVQNYGTNLLSCDGQVIYIKGEDGVALLTVLWRSRYRGLESDRTPSSTLQFTGYTGRHVTFFPVTPVIAAPVKGL